MPPPSTTVEDIDTIDEVLKTLSRVLGISPSEVVEVWENFEGLKVMCTLGKANPSLIRSRASKLD
jgi:hypothetical protein